MRKTENEWEAQIAHLKKEIEKLQKDLNEFIIKYFNSND